MSGAIGTYATGQGGWIQCSSRLVVRVLMVQLTWQVLQSSSFRDFKSSRYCSRPVPFARGRSWRRHWYWSVLIVALAGCSSRLLLPHVSSELVVPPATQLCYAGVKMLLGWSTECS